MTTIKTALKYVSINSGVCPFYFTTGKKYEVLTYSVRDNPENPLMTIEDDDGGTHWIRLHNCAHLAGGSWTLHRETGFSEFAELLDSAISDIASKAGLKGRPRIRLIDAPERDGDVTVTIEHPQWSGLRILTYKANGDWDWPSPEPLDYWKADVTE